MGKKLKKSFASLFGSDREIFRELNLDMQIRSPFLLFSLEVWLKRRNG